MILEIKPLSMAETKEYVEESEIKGFIKKFVKLNGKEAEKMKEELRKMDIAQIKEEHIVKLIDLLPEDKGDVNKIFSDTSLDENEITKILEVVKKYR